MEAHKVANNIIFVIRISIKVHSPYNLLLQFYGVQVFENQVLGEKEISCFDVEMS